MGRQKGTQNRMRQNLEGEDERLKVVGSALLRIRCWFAMRHLRREAAWTLSECLDFGEGTKTAAHDRIIFLLRSS